MENIEYKIKKSKRAKNIRLTIHSDASVVLTLPWWVPKTVGRQFVERKKKWLLNKLRITNYELRKSSTYTRKDYLENRNKARKFVEERLEFYNKLYNFSYGRISIRDTKTRWGSCSTRGNLNFSYKLLFLPPEIANYIIVHELCHLREMNHSLNFWSLVEKTFPNHKTLRKELKIF